MSISVWPFGGRRAGTLRLGDARALSQWGIEVLDLLGVLLGERTPGTDDLESGTAGEQIDAARRHFLQLDSIITRQKHPAELAVARIAAAAMLGLRQAFAAVEAQLALASAGNSDGPDTDVELIRSMLAGLGQEFAERYLPSNAAQLLEASLALPERPRGAFRRRFAVSRDAGLVGERFASGLEPAFAMEAAGVEDDAVEGAGAFARDSGSYWAAMVATGARAGTSSPAAAVEAEQSAPTPGAPTAPPGQRGPAPDPHDRRYPRSLLFKLGRWALRLWWLAFLLYFGNALFNLLTLFGQGSVAALLNGPNLVQALLLNQLAQLWTRSPAFVAGGAALVFALVLLGRMAHADQEREREVLRLRDEDARQAKQRERLAAAVMTSARAVASVAEPPARQPVPPGLAATTTAIAAASPSAPRVFISHSSADNDFGRRLAVDLGAALGGDADTVWYDAAPHAEEDYQGGLLGGDAFPAEIVAQLNDRNVFIVVLSPAAVRSGWVNYEIQLAVNRHNSPARLVIVPVMYRRCVLPDLLEIFQTIDFTVPEQYDRALIELEAVVRLGQSRPARRAGEPPFDEGLLIAPAHLVGRQGDREWVLQRLRAGETAGITALGGMGGIGKTALAAVAIRQLRLEGRFPDGIAVVLCQGLTDATDVLRRVLTRFDPQRRQPEASDPAGLAEAAHRVLDGRDALVVLDNVEPGWPIELVVAPLRAAGAALLLTARQVLSVEAVPVEGRHMLDLLPLPDALDLFAESFGRGQVLALSANDRAAAERIVKALDRHTLAVKLAGAYAAGAHRDLVTLAIELEQDPLGVPQGDAPRGVALVLGRSVSALDDDARRLFIACAVFATNEFGRQALGALGAGLDLSDPAASTNVLILRALLDATTNETLPAESDRERLRLHPLLRAFAATELARWPDAQRATAHLNVARHYSAYANATADAARAVDEANITGALEWAHAQGQDELVAALCSGMQYFWRDRGKTAASLRYLPWGVAAAEAGLGDRPAVNAADDPAAREALAAWEQRGDTLFWLVLNDGFAFQSTGRLDEALRRYERCLTLARQARARRNEGAALSVLGQVAQARGQLDVAADYYEQSLAIRRAVQDRQGEGAVLSNLGQVAQARGQLDVAAGYYEQSLAIRRAVQDRRGEGVVLTSLGQVAQLRGQLDAAAGYYEQALAIRRAVQDRQGEGVDLYSLAMIAEAQGDLDRAEALHRESLAIGNEVQSGPDVADSLLELGRFLVERRDNRDEGCRMLREAVHLYAEMGLPRESQARATARRLGCLTDEATPPDDG